VEETGKNPVIDGVELETGGVRLQNDRKIFKRVLRLGWRNLSMALALRSLEPTLNFGLCGSLYGPFFIRGLGNRFDGGLVGHLLSEGGCGSLAVLYADAFLADYDKTD
jgi:hypothetical protein